MSSRARAWPLALAWLGALPLAAQPAPDGALALDDTSNVTIDESSVELPVDSLARLGAIAIREIRIEGSSVFTAEELAGFTAPYENRMVTVEELHALTEAYVARGYVNSGVVIPDQRVADGVVVLRVVEGGLTRIDVQGNRRLKSSVIQRRIEREVEAPLNINAVQASLRSIREDPLVERVNAELLPGATPGESQLRVGITERRPWELDVSAGNDRSPSVGEHRGTVGIAYRGLIGNGDVLSGRFGLTQGVEDDVLSYRVPVTSGGATLDVLVADQQADIVEAPFDQIDIKSEIKSFGVTASYPFVRGDERGLAGIFGFEHKRSASTLLGLPFSFSPGDVDGKARGSAVSAGLEWTRRSDARAWALRGTVQIGVDALDATQQPSGPDGSFVAFLGQFQLVQQLAEPGHRLVARSVVQLAADPLLAMYKLPVGGRYSVRGYRENRFVRDNAMTASIEYQMPIVDGGRLRGFKVAVFADAGVSWDEDSSLATSRKERIASVGLGFLWDPVPAFHTELYWGMAMDDQNDVNGDALQDRGFNYGLSFSKVF
jgi:hemolysin activation/secretion protein